MHQFLEHLGPFLKQANNNAAAVSINGSFLGKSGVCFNASIYYCKGLP